MLFVESLVHMHGARIHTCFVIYAAAICEQSFAKAEVPAEHLGAGDAE